MACVRTRGVSGCRGQSVCTLGTYTHTSTARRARAVADSRASLRHACDDDDDDDEDDEDDEDGWRSIRAPRASSSSRGDDDDDDDDDDDGAG